MPMLCTICGHKKRREIDRALLERRPLRHTASQFGTSTGALQRHRAHVHRDLVEAHQTASRVEQFARADSLLADVRNAEGRAERLYGAAEDIRSARATPRTCRRPPVPSGRLWAR